MNAGSIPYSMLRFWPDTFTKICHEPKTLICLTVYRTVVVYRVQCHGPQRLINHAEFFDCLLRETALELCERWALQGAPLGRSTSEYSCKYLQKFGSVHCYFKRKT